MMPTGITWNADIAWSICSGRETDTGCGGLFGIDVLFGGVEHRLDLLSIPLIVGS